jgi:protein gp37
MELARMGWKTFASLEPLLGPINLDVPIGWVIIGGESGPGARPMHPDWVRAIRDQCVAAGIPFFFKQWGEWLPWREDMRDTSHGLPRIESVDGRAACGYYCDEGVGHLDHGSVLMARVGKKAAGRLLDGREWREMPQ